MKTDAMMEKIEARFDAWLEAFEEKPLSTGLKVFLVIVFLRWAWRSFK